MVSVRGQVMEYTYYLDKVYIIPIITTIIIIVVIGLITGSIS